ncbi:hypothetical protein L227DRAFT_543265 [Lentinus tigrinus ALCF2SS1-6]|uniref:Heterokaryon incompatibility domain-containing protein n=1 Tax=Lentinus tigrinus ALCF2SS1-6 TaxID=1328759 RepID=A0A5C2SIF2_9APHY|nr:hypothetical protein L227DRAFT_543265 [Lentinus tigrinus ALCF2SS1-6]
MRTASRPVDMIFSIMGLFGVVLDPSTFREDDLHGATLALIQAILAPRGRPSWLGAAFHLQFNEHIATFPTFPIASPAGPPRVRTMGREVEVSEVFGRPARLNGVMIPFPTCVIDDAGCLILTAGAIRLHAAFDVSAPGQLKFINAVDGSRWSMIPGEAGTESQAERDIYAVRIGLYGHEYDKVSVNTDPSLTIRIMLLEEHQPGLFHPRSYASLYVAELDFVLAWPDRTFCVGLSQTAKRTSAGNVICSERIICDVPVDSLEVSDPLNVLEAAPTCRFRLIDCEALVERNTLRIIELPDIPTTPFTTISYPWRGVFVDSTYSGHRFSVAGALGADPIAISVLKHACTASLIHASHYLWVDTLCIIQTSEEDKIWQIRHMYSVYKSCALCLVVPGGLQRLVPLDEVTPWIHRSWTLQEAIAPPLVVVLFAWKLGWAVGDNMVTNQAGSIREVVPGQSAIAPLSLILNASTEGFLEIGPASSQEARSGILLTCCIFGQAPSGQTPGVRNAAGASDLRRGLLAPNAIALAMAMDSNLRDRGPDIRSHAVWQSALMRTSSRPVDMILSIMGVFGVSLDPAAFHKDDRRGAAIALAQAILKRGGSASWLGAACGVPPEKTLSTFPSFPHNTINGVAFIHVNGEALKVTDLVGTVVYPMDYAGLGSLPKGSMDDTGYLTFSARATPLRYLEATDFEDLCNASTGGRIVMALDGSRWALGTATDTDTPSLNYSQRSTQVFGALLGWTNEYYPGISPLTFDNIRVVVLEEHRSDHFHVRTFFYLRRNEVRSILAWPERTFTVGGPDTPNSIAETGSLQRVLPEPAISSPLHRRSSELLRLEEAASQRAHRALPQRVLERFCEDDLQRHHSEFYVWTGMNVPPEHHNWTLV